MTQEVVHGRAMQAENVWSAAYPLIARVLASHGARRGVEVGVSFGGNSESMLTRCSLERLYGVDAYRTRPDYHDPANVTQSEFDAIHGYAAARLAKYGERFALIRASSEEGSQQVPDEMDFVYLDADHSFDGVCDDLRHWFPKVREGGIICGHDYGHPSFPGVQRAVDAFFSRLGWPVHVEGEGVWWAVKQAMPVSFFVPAYNCASTLSESISSITATNMLPDDEIIIVDDGSTDETWQCAQRLAAQDDRVRALRHRWNRGGATARNTGVEAARHPILFCLDSDNVLDRNTMGPLRHFMAAQGADVAAFQQLDYFRDAPGNTTHRWRFKAGSIGLHDYLGGTIVPGASGNYMFSLQSWQRARGYPEDARALDTWGFGLRQVATGAKMVTMPGHTYFHRHGHQSYWVRESRDKMTSLRALGLLIPFLDQIAPRDVNYLFGRRGRSSWFESLDRRPLRVRGMPLGRAGQVLPAFDSHPSRRAQKQSWWTSLIKGRQSG